MEKLESICELVLNLSNEELNNFEKKLSEPVYSNPLKMSQSKKKSERREQNLKSFVVVKLLRSELIKGGKI